MGIQAARECNEHGGTQLTGCSFRNADASGTELSQELNNALRNTNQALLGTLLAAHVSGVSATRLCACTLITMRTRLVYACRILPPAPVYTGVCTKLFGLCR